MTSVLCVSQLCVSEGRPDLERRVGDGVNPAEFPLSADICTDSACSGGNVGTSRKTSRSFSFFKRRPIGILLTMTTGSYKKNTPFAPIRVGQNVSVSTVTF